MHESIDAARRAAGLSWTELAERVGGPRVVLNGQFLPYQRGEDPAERPGRP